MKASLYQRIHTWYTDNGRHELPWRNTDNSYHIYLSEVMLQQTQVKTVLERFYFPFLDRFPTLQSVGEAPLDDVLKRWEGLGYYTRAKNLHRTAQLSRGKLPSTIEELLRLPGIGENTAHAIAAFAFHEAVPVMEANVRRILCRIHRLESPSHKKLWQAAYALLDRDNAYDYNQAMMDIGSMVCLPKEPRCEACPLADICKGKEESHRFPFGKKRIVPTKKKDILIYSYQDRLVLQQRKEKFLHGLWGFQPSVNTPCSAEYVGEVAHQYTHFKLICRVYHYAEADPEQEHYFSLSEIDKLAISKLDEKIIKLLLQFKTLKP